MWNRCLPAVVFVACVSLLVWMSNPGSAAPATRPTAAPSTQPAAGESAVPAELVGDWFSGTVSPTRYWNRDTGEFVGHGYSGALSYVFEKGGTYKRYFYLEIRLGGDVSSIFSASEGTISFSGNTLTLKPAKGTYRFIDGPGKAPRERPMQQDELERPGLVFNWQLEKKDGGPAVLLIGKEGEDPRTFNRSTE